MAVGGLTDACLNMDSNTDGLVSMMFLLYHHSFRVEHRKSWFVKILHLDHGPAAKKRLICNWTLCRDCNFLAIDL